MKKIEDQNKKRIPTNEFPEVFVKWLDEITKDVDWYNIQTQFGYVAFVRTKKEIGPEFSGIKHGYASLVVDKSGTFLEKKYRPMILDTAKGPVIVCD